MSDVPQRLLRETLRSQMTPESSACIDANTLAEWSDGSLSAADRATVESHASNCARCQAMLAAMARTEPPAPAPQPAWFRTWTLGWLIPIGTAAIALVVWINLPRTQTLQAPATTLAKDIVLQPPDAAPTTAAPSAPAARQVLAPEKRNAQRADAAAPTRQEQAAREPLTAAVTPPPAAAPTPPSPVTPAAPPTTTTADFARPPAAAGAAAASPPVPAMRASARLMMDAASKAEVQAPILSPDPASRWRIAGPGRVERSIDGGATWQPQTTGVPIAMTAGAAPAPDVCWLVGRGGTVLLSIDGRTWQRLAFPAIIDLVAVQAASATNATVRSIDSRRTWTTTDGGKTWTMP